MVLNLAPTLHHRRTYLFKKLSQAKNQLAHAYADEDKDPLHPQRIRKAKITLIRILLELHGSPELGPQRSFRWGYRLQTLLTHGVDNEIDWNTASQASSWYAAAYLLERSLNLSPDDLQHSHFQQDPTNPNMQLLPGLYPSPPYAHLQRKTVSSQLSGVLTWDCGCAFTHNRIGGCYTKVCSNHE